MVKFVNLLCLSLSNIHIPIKFGSSNFGDIVQAYIVNTFEEYIHLVRLSLRSLNTLLPLQNMHSFICIQNQEIPLHSTGLKQKCSPAPYKHPTGGRDAVGVALRLLSVSVEIRKHVKSTSEPRKKKEKKRTL